MGLQLFKPKQTDHEVITFTKLNRAFAGAWNAAAVALFGIFGAGTSSFFLGNGAKPSAGASGLVVNMAAGLGVHYVAGDDWQHNYRPLILTAVTGVTFDPNNDASGNDRIDLLCVKAEETESATETSKIKEAITKLILEKLLVQKVEYNLTTHVVKGTVAASPSAPATPAGYVPVAQVRVQNAATGFIATDITDVRPSTPARFQDLFATKITPDEIVTQGQSILACATWSYDGVAALGVDANCQIEMSRGIEKVTAQAGALNLLTVTFEEDHRPRSTNYLVFVQSRSDATYGSFGGSFKVHIATNEAFVLELFDAAGAVAAWPTDADKQFQVIVIDCTSL